MVFQRKKVDARYEWREVSIENGITRNLSTFVSTGYTPRRSCVDSNSVDVDRLPRTESTSCVTYVQREREKKKYTYDSMAVIPRNSYFSMTIESSTRALRACCYVLRRPRPTSEIPANESYMSTIFERLNTEQRTPRRTPFERYFLRSQGR